METQISFSDPCFPSSQSEMNGEIKISYPLAEAKNIRDAANTIRHNSEKYFSSHSANDIEKVTDSIDATFVDTTTPENIKLIELICKTSGFSKHDIEKWGLGLFRAGMMYDPGMRGVFIDRAIRNSRIIETSHGYLKRFGRFNPFKRWKEPKLLSHFISGNVVGYTAILSRIGFPVRTKGAAQILKLPSAASFFPLVYLKKIEEADPELRRTIACGYWKGGDDQVERTIIEESDAINILSSDNAIKDLLSRTKKYHPGITTLLHGHKIGIAYISGEFTEDEDKLEKTLDGLITDISAFDGAACYNVKNIFVQGDPRKFAEKLFNKLDLFERNVSGVSESSGTTRKSLCRVYGGSGNVISSETGNAFVRIREYPEFWLPDEAFRYVQVMKVKDENEVYNVIKGHSRFLQTAIIAVPDEKIVPLLLLFGKAGVSNVHYPGSAPLINVYEEPHDGEFDSVKVRYGYSSHFTATNFKRNRDWLT